MFKLSWEDIMRARKGKIADAQAKVVLGDVVHAESSDLLKEEKADDHKIQGQRRD